MVSFPPFNFSFPMVGDASGPTPAESFSPMSDQPSQQVEPMEVEEDSRKRKWEGTAELEASVEEMAVSSPQEKRRRIDADEPMSDDASFVNLLGILSNHRIFYLYKSIFGCPLLALPKTIKEAIKQGDNEKLREINSLVLQTLQQLLQLQAPCEAIQREVWDVFGCIDPSHILESQESCLASLQAIYDANMCAVGGRIFQQSFFFHDIHSFNETANEISQKLGLNANTTTELNLCDAGISILPLVLTHYKNLRYLDLSSNPGIIIPGPIENLYRLETLKIAGCSFSEIPSWVFKHKSMTCLDVRRNHITCLPHEMEQLLDLTDLDISNNPISSIQFDVDQLTKLRHVCISNDQLMMLPPDFIGKLGSKVEIVPPTLGSELVPILPL
jgi:hypothetical protein